MECVPAKLAQLISSKLTIPTIGIGAGKGCDGQILVYQDMLGMFNDFTPKFVKQYNQVGELIKSSIKAYKAEVEEGLFPGPEHEFSIDDTIIEKLY